jgi:hypothetical protein
MTFTFATDLSTDLALVRFHIGDTDSDGYFLADETITALLTSSGSVGGAVIASLRYIVSQLSRPDFRADWLSVSNASARQGYLALLAEKRGEFGLSAITASATHVYRADSDQTEEPDYDADYDTDDDDD